MSKDGSEPVIGDVSPKRFGINYDPPSIILEYLQISTGKLFHRRIGLKRLRASSDPTRVAEKLRQRNRALLPEDRVSLEQIVSLVKRLQESMGENVKNVKGIEFAPSQGLGLSNQGPAAGDRGLDTVTEDLRTEECMDYSTEDLNKLTPEELIAHKAKMDVMFFRNQKKPGDADFVYDVRVDFPEVDQGDEQQSGWDSEEDLDESTGND